MAGCAIRRRGSANRRRPDPGVRASHAEPALCGDVRTRALAAGLSQRVALLRSRRRDARPDGNLGSRRITPGRWEPPVRPVRPCVRRVGQPGMRVVSAITHTQIQMATIKKRYPINEGSVGHVRDIVSWLEHFMAHNSSAYHRCSQIASLFCACVCL